MISLDLTCSITLAKAVIFVARHVSCCFNVNLFINALYIVPGDPLLQVDVSVKDRTSFGVNHEKVITL